jgi:hypothetical protein
MTAKAGQAGHSHGPNQASRVQPIPRSDERKPRLTKGA